MTILPAALADVIEARTIAEAAAAARTSDRARLVVWRGVISIAPASMNGLLCFIYDDNTQSGFPGYRPAHFSRIYRRSAAWAASLAGSESPRAGPASRDRLPLSM